MFPLIICTVYYRPYVSYLRRNEMQSLKVKFDLNFSEPLIWKIGKRRRRKLFRLDFNRQILKILSSKFYGTIPSLQANGSFVPAGVLSVPSIRDRTRLPINLRGRIGPKASERQPRPLCIRADSLDRESCRESF